LTVIPKSERFPQLSFNRSLQILSRRHGYFRSPSPSCFNFFSYLTDCFIDIPHWIAWQSHQRLTNGFLTHSTLQVRLISLLQLINQPDFPRRCKERHGCCYAYNYVEIDTGPHKKRSWKFKYDERHHSKTKRCLCDNECNEVIVSFGWSGALAVGSHEERPNIATKVYNW
jgi:hypothetical protein